MSHFVVLVLVKEPITSTEQAEEVVEPLLKPFDENLEAPEHSEPCYCVGNEANRRAREAANEKFGTWDDQRVAYHSDPEVKQLVEREHQLRFPEDHHERSKEEKAQLAALEKKTQAMWLERVVKPRE